MAQKLKDCKCCSAPFEPKRKNGVHCNRCLVSIRFQSTSFHCSKCGDYDCSPVWWIVEESICRKCRKPTPARKTNPSTMANVVVARFVKNGYISPPAHFKCVDCGERAYCWEHRDYNRPLDIEPTCQSCNKLRGAGIPLVIGGLVDESKFEKFEVLATEGEQ